MPLSRICRKLLIGRLVAVFDGIGAGIDRCLYGGLVDGVDGNFQVVAVRFFDHRRKLRDGKVLVCRNLDDIHVLEDILPDCLASRVGPINQQELLLQDRLGKGRIEVLNVFAARNELACGGQDSRTRDTACIDGVTQFGIAVNSGMAKIANGGDAALQVFARHLRAEQGAFARRLDDGQQQFRSKQTIGMARPALLRAGTTMSINKCVWPSIKPGSNVALPRSMILTPAGAAACTCEGEPTSLILPSSISTAAGARIFPVRRIEQPARFDQSHRNRRLGGRLRSRNHRHQP